MAWNKLDIHGHQAERTIFVLWLSQIPSPPFSDPPEQRPRTTTNKTIYRKKYLSISISTCKDSGQPCACIFTAKSAHRGRRKKRDCVAVDDRPLRFYFGFLSSPAAPAACIFRQKAAQSTKSAQRMHWVCAQKTLRHFYKRVIPFGKDTKDLCADDSFFRHPEDSIFRGVQL